MHQGNTALQKAPRTSAASLKTQQTTYGALELSSFFSAHGLSSYLEIIGKHGTEMNTLLSTLATDLANVNSAGKSFIVDQLTYGVPETREINVVYQAEKAGYAYVSAKASSNANTTDKIASMVVQASPYADFSQNNIYARRNDLNANASATHIQFIPEGWYYRFVTYNSTDETLRFFPVNSDN